jgi:hypothetical protein
MVQDLDFRGSPDFISSHLIPVDEQRAVSGRIHRHLTGQNAVKSDKNDRGSDNYSWN